MRLKTLTLRNFGLYRGEQTIDLLPRTRGSRRRPIVLVGGHNGAGKTTILEAIRLCLYGRLALGNRVTDVEYHAHLRERIHRNRDAIIPVSYSSVAIEFEFAHAGRPSTYLVHRAWETKGANGVSESLRVLRDGAPLGDVESQFWPEFVRSLVPPGVSQLFFFDGEKIKRLAEEASEAEALAESVKALLGLDLVERLQTDLDLYTSKFVRKTVTGSLATRLAEIEQTQRRLRSELELVVREETERRGDVLRLSETIARVEQQLAQSGEGLSARRGDLQRRVAELQARQAHLEKLLREACEGPLPFAICRSLSLTLQERLTREAAAERLATTQAEIDKALLAVSMRLTRGAFPRRLGWDARTRAEIQTELEEVAATLRVDGASNAAAARLHDVSQRDREHIQDALGQGLNAASARVTEVTRELEEVVQELRKTSGRLSSTPETEEIAPLVRQLSALQEEHAARSLEATLKDEQRTKLERDLAALERERLKIVQSEKEARTLAGRLTLATKAKTALDEYLRRLTVAKVSELQVVAAECFSILSRKADLVAQMSIDPTTFEVTLRDRSGDVVPKASLSAGEKQLYAVSLLWALARVSGRPLPMIVDTPLGRLDSVHRQRLLERYFPHASHQVIVLSTDTEVDRQYFDLLRPHTSHSLHLVHRAGHTEVTTGYFWKEEGDVGASA